MVKTQKNKQQLPPAHTDEEISDHYNLTTGTVSVVVEMGPESRSLVREFLEGLDENLTVAQVKSALEADWS